MILLKTNAINIDLYLELKVTHDHKTLSRKIIFLEPSSYRLHDAQTKPMPFEYYSTPYQFSSRLYIGLTIIFRTKSPTRLTDGFRKRSQFS